MPASNIDSYLEDARKNFDAVRPAPIYADTNQSTGQCQNIHVSTNCYYGYHNLKNIGNNHVDTDCEMVELEAIKDSRTPSKSMSKKRCAEEQDYPQTKRLRDENNPYSYSNEATRLFCSFCCIGSLLLLILCAELQMILSL